MESRRRWFDEHNSHHRPLWVMKPEVEDGRLAELPILLWTGRIQCDGGDQHLCVGGVPR
ncbi:hypothetical protein VQ056_00265 [Paenibacillus sp. JTLBN-2024]